jgi:hypothetical protein
MSDPSADLVFVHRMHLNTQSWSPWIERACDAGFSPIALFWPFHQGEPATLRTARPPTGVVRVLVVAGDGDELGGWGRGVLGG